jgi:peptidyl-prolyl cis-trans isomerase C
VKLILFIWICFFSFLSAGTAGQEAIDSGDDIVASVGEAKITKQEYKNYLLLYRKSGDFKKIAETLTPVGKARILNELIEHHVLVLEAKNSGLDKDPRVRQAIESAIQNVLATSLLKKELSHLDLTDEGLRLFYRENPESFMTGKRVKARHIITKTEEEAETALNELDKGIDFIMLASERNIDSTKSKGGELGWIVKGSMVKPFEDALFSLKKAQLSDIVKTSFGFHIIKVEEIDKGKPKSFETVKDEIKKQMIEHHIFQLKDRLRGKYPVFINKKVLQAEKK